MFNDQRVFKSNRFVRNRGMMVFASSFARGRSLDPRAVAYARELRKQSLKNIKDKLDHGGILTFSNKEIRIARQVTGMLNFWNFWNIKPDQIITPKKPEPVKKPQFDREDSALGVLNTINRIFTIRPNLLEGKSDVFKEK